MEDFDIDDETRVLPETVTYHEVTERTTSECSCGIRSRLKDGSCIRCDKGKDI
jgi:hypothetical protein